MLTILIRPGTAWLMLYFQALNSQAFGKATPTLQRHHHSSSRDCLWCVRPTGAGGSGCRDIKRCGFGSGGSSAHPRAVVTSDKSDRQFHRRDDVTRPRPKSGA